MANISAKEVNELRKITGSGMMDCKKALTESGGDIEKAIEVLRKKGQKIALSRGDRDAKEGVVVVEVALDKKSASIIKLTCETDFVAKNQDFIHLANSIIKVAFTHQCNDIDELKKHTLEDGKSIEETLLSYIAKIGEKIDIAQIISIKAEGIVSYIHGQNRIGVLVGINKTLTENIEEDIKSIAMQVAAMNPLAMDEHSVSSTIVEREKAIIAEQINQDHKNANKPANIMENIIKGKLNAFFKENTLLAQPFIKDSSKNVKGFLGSIDKDLKIDFFKRVAIG